MPSIKDILEARKAALAAQANSSNSSNSLVKPNACINANSNLAVEAKPISPLAKVQLYVNSLGQSLNPKQCEAVDRAIRKESFCLIGAAGTGKTTTVRAICEQLIRQGKLSAMPSTSLSKHLRSKLSVAFVAFTNRAVKRLRKSIPEELQSNALTIHKLLEYQPTFIEAFDEFGQPCNKKIFAPKLGLGNHDANLQLLVIEESSMVSVELHQQLVEAFPNATIIYLGDLNQLPPVYGASILGYKLTHLPIVELTEVYRQAAGSQIIQLAYEILQSQKLQREFVDAFKNEDNQNGKVIFHTFKKRIESDLATMNFCKFILNRVDQKLIDLDEVQILIPFNEQFGTINVNKLIAQHLTTQRGECTHEIHASFLMQYYAIGDKVLHEKEVWKITDIVPNAFYAGTKALRASIHLDRWGHLVKTEDDLLDLSLDEGDEEFKLTDCALDETSDDLRKRAASHIVKLQSLDDPSIETELSTSGDINAMELAYAMTVHKAQGCEWDHVIFVAHHSHGVLLSRELIYTAVTRAAKKLEIVGDWEAFAKAPTKHKVKGNTLKEKITAFIGKTQSEVANGINPITNERIAN